jgi:hypothetical protein
MLQLERRRCPIADPGEQREGAAVVGDWLSDDLGFAATGVEVHGVAAGMPRRWLFPGPTKRSEGNRRQVLLLRMG